MSYIRFGEQDSDVYVYASAQGYECCGCVLRTSDKYRVRSMPEAEDIVAHLRRHIAAGDHVPAHVIPAILAGVDDGR